MDVKQFVRSIPNFGAKIHAERILYFAWFLHSERNLPAFNAPDITKCYRDADLDEPGNMSSMLRFLTMKIPPELLKDSRGYRLSHQVQEKLDASLGKAVQEVVVEKKLAELPGKIADQGERLYLTETL